MLSGITPALTSSGWWTGRLSFTGKEAILYIVASCHFILGALPDMALAGAAIRRVGLGRQSSAQLGGRQVVPELSHTWMRSPQEKVEPKGLGYKKLQTCHFQNQPSPPFFMF